MHITQELPVLRILLPFLAGILTYINLGISSTYTFPIFLLTSLFFLAFSQRMNKRWKFQWINGLLINLIIFLAAICLTQYNDEEKNPTHFSRQNLDQFHFAMVSIVEAPKISAKSWKAVLKVNSLINSTGIGKEADGKIMAYFSKEIPFENLMPGRILLIKFNPKSISAPKNPGEFNYQRYLSFHGIYHQQFIRQHEVSFTQINGSRNLLIHAWKIRNKVLDILKQIGAPAEDFGVLAALVTGHEEDLTPDTIRAYSATGALHVLSVSGMHVGIIFLLLDLVLKHLEKIKHGKTIRLITSIAILWFYAMFTGLSPSVLRACTMFTFLQAGKYFQKNPNSLNTLLSSGLVLLLINPYLATEVGFQLSFCAVGGIILFYQRIHEVISPQNWILKQAWSITAVSIAAQISTFPMGLLYFHCFPNYFLLSNLIIIPLTTVILYAGMLFVFISKISLINTLVSWSTVKLLWVLRKIVFHFETLPFAQLSGIDFSIAETFVLYGIITFFTLFILNKKANHLIMAMSLILGISIINLFQSLQNENQKSLVIYAIPKNNAMAFMNGRKLVLFSENDFLKNENAQRFHCFTHWYSCGIESKSFQDITAQSMCSVPIRIHKTRNIFLFENRTILLNPVFSQTTLTTKIDIVYLTQKNYPDSMVINMIPKIKNSIVVLGSEISQRKILLWKKILKQEKIRTHSIQEDGFFEYKL
jgi:competence protein ComEC